MKMMGLPEPETFTSKLGAAIALAAMVRAAIMDISFFIGLGVVLLMNPIWRREVVV